MIVHNTDINRRVLEFTYFSIYDFGFGFDSASYRVRRFLVNHRC